MKGDLARVNDGTRTRLRMDCIEREEVKCKRMWRGGGKNMRLSKLRCFVPLGPHGWTTRLTSSRGHRHRASDRNLVKEEGR